MAAWPGATGLTSGAIGVCNSILQPHCTARRGVGVNCHTLRFCRYIWHSSNVRTEFAQCGGGAAGEARLNIHLCWVRSSCRDLRVRQYQISCSTLLGARWKQQQWIIASSWWVKLVGAADRFKLRLVSELHKTEGWNVWFHASDLTLPPANANTTRASLLD